MSKLTLTSSIRLSSGFNLPLLGLGVYRSEAPYEASVAALKHGYRHIDSAKMYANEADVARAVRDSGVPRSEVFVTSKCNHSTAGYNSTLTAVDESLRKFGFDYIDLYLIHDPLAGKTKRIETWKALLEKKKEGKLRTIGVSNYGPKHLDEIVAAGLELPAVNQVELHPWCAQKPIVEWCKRHSVVIEAYCPVVRMDPPKVEDLVVVGLAKKHNKTVPQVLIRWSLQKGYVPLPKSSNAGRIAENADLYDFELDADDMGKLDSLDQGDDGAISWNPVNAD